MRIKSLTTHDLYILSRGQPLFLTPSASIQGCLMQIKAHFLTSLIFFIGMRAYYTYCTSLGFFPPDISETIFTSLHRFVFLFKKKKRLPEIPLGGYFHLTQIGLQTLAT